MGWKCFLFGHKMIAEDWRKTRWFYREHTEQPRQYRIHKCKRCQETLHIQYSRSVYLMQPHEKEDREEVLKIAKASGHGVRSMTREEFEERFPCHSDKKLKH